MRFRSFKGAPTLRVLIFGSLTLMMVMYAFIYFAGGYLYYNGGSQNATLNTQYQAIAGNTAQPGGIFGNLGGLQNQLVGQGTNYSQSTGQAISIGGIIGTISAFFNTIPPILGTAMYWAGSVFSVFGVPSSFFILIGTMMVIALILIVIITIVGVVYA